MSSRSLGSLRDVSRPYQVFTNLSEGHIPHPVSSIGGLLSKAYIGSNNHSPQPSCLSSPLAVIQRQEDVSELRSAFQRALNLSTNDEAQSQMALNGIQTLQASPQNLKDNVTTLMENGIIHFNNGEFAIAIHFFQQGLLNTQLSPENRFASDGTNALLYFFLGSALEKIDDLDGSINAWQTGLNFANGHWDIQSALYTFLGNAHYQKNEFQFALCAYRNAFLIIPKPSDAERLNQISTCAQIMQESPRMEENILALLQDGLKYYENRQFDKTITFFRQGLYNQSANPQYPVSDQTNALLYFNLGHALLQNKHLDEAIATWQKGITYKNATPETLSNLHAALGHTYSQKNEIHTAIGYFQLASQFAAIPHLLPQGLSRVL